MPLLKTFAVRSAVAGLLFGLLGSGLAQGQIDRPGLLEPAVDARPLTPPHPQQFARENASRPARDARQQATGPAAILIRNPHTSSGAPPFALADEFGRVQRLVEPSHGIDLNQHVGSRVTVRHDTGRTLLASQLDLLPTNLPSLPTPTHLPMPAQTATAQAATTQTASPPVRHHPAVTPITGALAYVSEEQTWGATPPRPVIITQFGEGASENRPPVIEALPAGSDARPGVPEPIILEEVIGNPVVQPIEGLPLPPQNSGELIGAPVVGAPVIGPPASESIVPNQHATAAPTRRGRRQPRLFGYGELLILQPSGGDVTHAQQLNGTVPFGSVATIDSGFDAGFRLGIGTKLSKGGTLEASYAFFESGGLSSLAPPSVAGGVGTVGSLVFDPGTALTPSLDTVSAQQSIDFQLGDLLYRDRLGAFCGATFNYSLGLQYADLEQDFSQLGTFGGTPGGAISTATSIDFNGGGLKAGVDGARRISSNGLFYGRLSGALMSGEFEASYSQFNTTTGAALAAASFEQDQVVPQIEFELGLAYQPRNRPWTLSAGYQFQHWFNVITTPEFIGAVQTDNFTGLGDTLSFDGFTLRAESRW